MPVRAATATDSTRMAPDPLPEVTFRGGRGPRDGGACGKIGYLAAALPPGTPDATAPCRPSSVPSLSALARAVLPRHPAGISRAGKPTPHPGRCAEVADEIGHLPRRPGRILLATKWSLQGLRAAWLNESSFRLEVYLFVVLAPLGLWLGASAIERALLLGSCLLVLSIELLNSAIEAVIERYGAEHHELAGRAKDMGSAAVFVLMLNVLLTWGLILGPRLF